MKRNFTLSILFGLLIIILLSLYYLFTVLSIILFFLGVFTYIISILSYAKLSSYFFNVRIPLSWGMLLGTGLIGGSLIHPFGERLHLQIHIYGVILVIAGVIVFVINLFNFGGSVGSTFEGGTIGDRVLDTSGFRTGRNSFFLGLLFAIFIFVAGVGLMLAAQAISTSPPPPVQPPPVQPSPSDPPLSEGEPPLPTEKYDPPKPPPPGKTSDPKEPVEPKPEPGCGLGKCW
jgi:hypothetical protein